MGRVCPLRQYIKDRVEANGLGIMSREAKGEIYRLGRKIKRAPSKSSLLRTRGPILWSLALIFPLIYGQEINLSMLQMWM